MMATLPYGKAVDIWAAGFIMYELLTGIHPLYTKGEEKQSYREKLKNFKGFTYPPKIQISK